MDHDDVTRTKELTDNLILELKSAVNKHGRDSVGDSIQYNGATVLALAATTAATILPEGYSTLTRILTGLATFLIAIIRALNFGMRWRFHKEMKSKYQNLLDAATLVPSFPEDKQLKAVQAIHSRLSALRVLEGAMPGMEVPEIKIAP